MIKSITIKDVATFNNEGVNISELKPINIIYGTNGSGKSTITKVVEEPEPYPSCNVEWENDTPIKVLAYNQEFRRKNYKEYMQGIFTLGEDNNDTYARIKEKKETLSNVERNLSRFNTSIKNKEQDRASKENEFQNVAWENILKRHETSFSKSLIGIRTMAEFKNGILDAYHYLNDHPYDNSITFEELEKKAKVLSGPQPDSAELIEELTHIDIASIETNSIWNKIIIGKDDVDIAGLIMALRNTDWVSQGLQYIQDGSDVCPFCQQHTITNDFKRQISDFFDEEYKNNLNLIRELASQYETTAVNLLRQIYELLSKEKAKAESFIDLPKTGTIYTTLRTMVTSNIEKTQIKLKEPSRQINLDSTLDVLKEIIGLIEEANSAISERNALVENYIEELEALINNIWQFYAHSNKALIESYLKRIEGCNKAITKLQKIIGVAEKRKREIEVEIRALENTITSVTRTVNEINRLLKSFGFTNFKIREVPDQPNHYQIVRENGQPAKDTLSEGESSFITFLYYMQLINGSFLASGISEDKILIVDDPVSSLDSNVLFIVSTLLRKVFQNVHKGNTSMKQIILFTHNVYFHKEVAYYDRKCCWKNDVNYWILRKSNDISSIQGYGKENPIKSSYELLWKELKNPNVTSHVNLQNIMRRIIENYFLIFGGCSVEQILQTFDSREDQLICHSLLSWVNSGSHTFNEDLFMELSEDQSSRYKDIFYKIFKNMHQEEHYKMMMGSPDQESYNVE